MIDKDRVTKVVLDSNVWDRLAVDGQARERIRALCEVGQLEVLIPDTLHRQLQEPPFNGVPGWFPTVITTDSVFVLDHSRLDYARLGDGVVFEAHRGKSRQTSDAVIVDAADTDADAFVSEDRRARERYATLRGRDRSLDYARFRAQVLGL